MNANDAERMSYLSGFGNEHESEALPGALPVGRFSPQRVAYGLYTEKFSGTAFTAPRDTNRRTWFYRLRPSVVQGRFHLIHGGWIRSAPCADLTASPDPLRWDPLPIPSAPTDFVDGLTTFAVNGDVSRQAGMGVHVYLANQSMTDRYFYSADGEFLIVPQQGGLVLHTECGKLAVAPGEMALLPRGMKCRVELADGTARGYVAENYGAPLRLPERGPVGSDGFANARDFYAPVASYEERTGSFELVCKFQGRLYANTLDHSPLDVVAWVGTNVPYKYDLRRFNTMGSVSYDHPDPSIYTVLTSPSETVGTANLDFVIFPERWLVAEDAFRPPWYHRNIMSEFMGLIEGVYDAKETGFVPGGASLHNAMVPHGPDAEAFANATAATLTPTKLSSTLAFMFESRYVFQPTEFALASFALQTDYAACWSALESHFDGRP